MENAITPKQETALASTELINEARQLSGEISGTRIPFIPIITINNKWEVMPDKSKKPPKKGFSLTQKVGSENVTEFWQEELEGVILRVRFAIASKNKIEPRYWSREFDNFIEPIEIFDGNKNLLVKGTYAELGEQFATGEKDSMGRPKKSYDLFVILYLDVAGTVYRLKLKGKGRANLFDYKNTFGPNDSHVAYKTKFALDWGESGDVGFWFATMTRGEHTDIGKELAILRDLNSFFQMVKGRPSVVAPQVVPGVDVVEEAKQAFGEVEDVTEQQDVSQIPF